MGPYCEFCNTRCFKPTAGGIGATCAAGRAFEIKLKTVRTVAEAIANICMDAPDTMWNRFQMNSTLCEDLGHILSLHGIDDHLIERGFQIGNSFPALNVWVHDCVELCRLKSLPFKMKPQKTICPSCKTECDSDDIETYMGEEMCLGCAETADMMAHDDPHGRGWAP